MLLLFQGGAPDKFIVADMPFLSCSKGLEVAMDAVQRLMQAGANAVKIEGASHQLPVIRQIIEAGVPVMGPPGPDATVDSQSRWP